MPVIWPADEKLSPAGQLYYCPGIGCRGQGQAFWAEILARATVMATSKASAVRAFSEPKICLILDQHF
jgi:hypothetical protein